MIGTRQSYYTTTLKHKQVDWENSGIESRIPSFSKRVKMGHNPVPTDVTQQIMDIDALDSSFHRF